MSKLDGMLEFVSDSKTIQDILKENDNRIDKYLKNLSHSDSQYD